MKKLTQDEAEKMEAAVAGLLTSVAELHASVRDARILAAQNARTRGMTNQRIGELLGLSEAGVRMMLLRSPEAREL